jgi:hypothetical protein
MLGHVLELLTPLGAAPPDVGVLSWVEWTRIVEGAG